MFYLQTPHFLDPEQSKSTRHTRAFTVIDEESIGAALPQKSDYLRTFGANCISASKTNLTDWTGVQPA